MAHGQAGFEGAVDRLFSYLAKGTLLAVVAGLCAWPLTATGVQVATAKSFAPSTINSGQSTKLTISVVNNDPQYPADLLAFSDTFPAGMTLIAGTQTNTCAGSLTTTANSLSLSGGFVAPLGGNCAVSTLVTATAAASTTLTNVTSSFTCIAPVGGCSGKAAGANLFVVGAGVPPTITSAPPPPGTLGVPYVYQVTVSGQPIPTVSASNLPPGLSFLSATDQFFGTPTQVGSFVTTVQASNGVPPNDTRNYTIVINPPLLIAIPGGGSALPGGSTGKPYGPVTFTASGGTPPYTWRSCKRPLPAGLSFSAGGTLAGTPTQTGSFILDVCVKDSLGAAGLQAFTVDIATVTTTMSVTATPNPAVSSVPVVVAANVTGASVAAMGIVQFWVAGPGTRCPAQFAAGAPSDPEAAMQSAALDAGGRAQVTYPNLRIDDYLVCAQYPGDALYPAAAAGPIDLYVIKGVLPPPPVNPVAPSQAQALAAVAPAAIIPTLREWLLGALVLILVASGLRRLRRR